MRTTTSYAQKVLDVREVRGKDQTSWTAPTARAHEQEANLESKKFNTNMRVVDFVRYLIVKSITHTLIH